ncbi:uncharacterized protein LOC111694462 [Trichogramma pretiosum]|uniref:uncharacterized protein LOC111694462 n=1 Tax=Trichogramma pretiosum TaxID=7493 RepID=UPI000C71A2E6|nr:uncharacterized protein LOC111694462 [Trichogramma pretiosum]
MRKSAFASRRFQIKFGITEEDEEEVQADLEDVTANKPSPPTSQDIVQEPPEVKAAAAEADPELLLQAASLVAQEAVAATSPVVVSATTAAVVSITNEECRTVALVADMIVGRPKLPAAPTISSPPAGRRQTMPEISSEHLSRFSEHRQKSLLGVPAEQSRRPSITDVAICSSIGPSLAGIFPGAPGDLFSASGVDPASSPLLISTLRRSSTYSALNEPIHLEEAVRDARGRRWSARLPFLRGLYQDSRDSGGEIESADDDQLQLAQQRPKHHHHYHHHHHHHHHLLPHLHVPTFSVTDGGPGQGRKFSFGIRRHSHAVC